jgi:hypothetical protein
VWSCRLLRVGGLDLPEFDGVSVRISAIHERPISDIAGCGMHNHILLLESPNHNVEVVDDETQVIDPNIRDRMLGINGYGARV